MKKFDKKALGIRVAMFAWKATSYWAIQTMERGITLHLGKFSILVTLG